MISDKIKKEYCQVAAMWLSDFLREIKLIDTGEVKADMVIDILRIGYGKTYPKEICDKFETAMVDKLLNQELPIKLWFDYNPPLLVMEVFQEVTNTKTSGSLNFPAKAGLKIDQSGVYVADGYAAPFEKIY